MRGLRGLVEIGFVFALAQFPLSADSAADPATTAAEHPADQGHWAYQPLAQVSPPDDPTGWATKPLDKFVAEQHRLEGLQPVQLADKQTLIRRAYLDLIGLPPTPEEIDEFLADKSEAAFSKLVDRLLSSQHYGERWGRHWLDVVRYADTAGDNSDCPVPEIYLYRDYVIDAFNNDKRYDLFLQEQLAGDLMVKNSTAEHFAERIIATGYIALAKRFGTKPYEYRHMEIGDVIDCTGRALLGITMSCARCHDHKFDPMTNEDYYALYGIFESTTYSFSGSEASKKRQNLVSLLYPNDEYAARKQKFHEQMRQIGNKIKELEGSDPLTVELADLNKKIPDLEKQIGQRESAGEDVADLKQKLEKLTKQRDDTGAALEAKLEPLRASRAMLNEAHATLFETVAFAASEGKATDVALQNMGDPKQPGEVIHRGVPEFLSPAQPLDVPDKNSGRLEFARWLTNPGTVAEGLVARVLVNRIWQHHFGRGIVATPSNFGLNGQPPTHPELLEWLATQFVDRGWSIKTMHRVMMLSKTYRLSSQYDEANAAIDPAAKWLWRCNRRRLDAEVIRDSMLALSGKLDRNRPGAHPFPPASEWKFNQGEPFKDIYPSKHRSVYLMTCRNQRHPYLAIFDGPDPNLSTGLRTRSMLPQQTLYLMNNSFVHDQAKGFADSLLHGSSSTEERINDAHRRAWGRRATPMELDRDKAYLDTYRQQLQREAVPDEELEIESWSSLTRLMLTANEFLYVE
jgi:hypothetical protein